jgi:hypothetical protein
MGKNQFGPEWPKNLTIIEFLDISIKFPFDDLAQIAISVLVLLPFSNWSGLLAK